DCRCQKCTKMRTRSQCENPHTCGMRAKELLDQLPEKWDPRCSNSQATLVRRQVSRSQEDRTEEWIDFAHNLIMAMTLSDIF
ncbi:hypothetical protein FOMPIDRAFT_58965, partial [Fomitopsis schrenkii]